MYDLLMRKSLWTPHTPHEVIVKKLIEDQLSPLLERNKNMLNFLRHQHQVAFHDTLNKLSEQRNRELHSALDKYIREREESFEIMYIKPFECFYKSYESFAQAKPGLKPTADDNKYIDHMTAPLFFVSPIIDCWNNLNHYLQHYSEHYEADMKRFFEVAQTPIDFKHVPVTFDLIATIHLVDHGTYTDDMFKDVYNQAVERISHAADIVKEVLQSSEVAEKETHIGDIDTYKTTGVSACELANTQVTSAVGLLSRPGEITENVRSVYVSFINGLHTIACGYISRIITFFDHVVQPNNPAPASIVIS